MAEEEDRPKDAPDQPEEAANDQTDQPDETKSEQPANSEAEAPGETEDEAAVDEEEEKPPMTSNDDTTAFAAHKDAAAEQVEDIRPDIPAFRVPRERLVDAMTYLQQELRYDHLACITAIDWEEGNLEVVYNLWSYAKNRPLAVRVPVSADDAVVPSITSLWKGADWLEREEYDLMGIRFEGHPDLRRIMLPEGWHGHPLRKDYDLKREQYVGMDDEGDDVVYVEPREDAW